jgi:hypothetical protein
MMHMASNVEQTEYAIIFIYEVLADPHPLATLLSRTLSNHQNID